ncbi:MAG: ATP-grasp domain-containing protein [Frankiaceae bacterium]
MPERGVRRSVVLCKWQPELLVALLDDGATVHLVLDRYDRFQDTADDLLARCRSVYRISSFDSVEEVAEVAVDLRLSGAEIDLVLSHNEWSQFGAGYLELLLGTAQDPLLRVSHRDKRLMKQRVRAAGVTTARFVSVPDASDPAAAATVVRDLPLPVVVKPAAGYGAVSTVRVDDAARLPEVLAGFTFDPLLHSRQLIVEEFITGVELAVDAIWSNGEALAFVVHRYRDARMTMAEPTKLDGSWVLRPADHQETYDRLREVHRRINPVLGIHEGASHMEVFVRPDGEVVFSEIATRPAGGWAPVMLRAYLGRPVWDLLAQVLLHGTAPAPRPSDRYVGAVHLRPAKPGVISRAPEDAELAACPGIVTWQRIRGVGDRARFSHPSEFYLHVAIEADTPDELEALAARVAEQFPIETTGDRAASTERLRGARRAGA